MTDYLKRISKVFALGRDGNIGLTAALTIPMLLAAIGIALDHMAMVNDQRVLQDALDAAAVSTASSMANGKNDEITAKTYAADFVMAALGNELTATEKADLKTKLVVTVTPTTTSGKKTYDIKLSGGFTVQLSPFSRFAGNTQRPVAAASSTRSEVTSKLALSMYVVFDRSGSMSFVTDSVDKSKTKCRQRSAPSGCK